jgi:hypothetical protein
MSHQQDLKIAGFRTTATAIEGPKKANSKQPLGLLSYQAKITNSGLIGYALFLCGGYILYTNCFKMFSYSY